MHHHNLKSQPSSVGIFFARSPCVGAVSGPCLLSTPLPKSPFQARIPPFFLSLFSVALLSIQGPKSCVGVGLRAIGLLLRLL